MNVNNPQEAGALVASYAPLAARIATALAASKDKGKAAGKDRQSAWTLFKSAIPKAKENGHEPADLRQGLQIACLLAGIPDGTVRGYVSTIENLYGDLLAGTIDTVKLNEISVAEARERYLSAEAKAVKAAKKALADLIEDWSAEQIQLLVSVAVDAITADDDEGEGEQEGEPDLKDGTNG